MLRLIIYGIVEMIFLLTFLPLGFLEGFLPKKINPDPQKRKIIFLHAWLNKNPIYLLLKHRLEKLGYSVIMPDFGWHTDDIERNTQRLKKFISDNVLQSFILVGHSIGGIIALNYYKENHNKVDMLITLGAPFKGWTIPFSFFSQSAKQIMPGSAFLNKLRSDIALSAPKEKVFCLFAKYDEIVLPKSAQLPFAKNIKVNTFGHMSFIYSKSVMEALRKILALDKF